MYRRPALHRSCKRRRKPTAVQVFLRETSVKCEKLLQNVQLTFCGIPVATTFAFYREILADVLRELEPGDCEGLHIGFGLFPTHSQQHLPLAVRIYDDVRDTFCRASNLLSVGFQLLPLLPFAEKFWRM